MLIRYDNAAKFNHAILHDEYTNELDKLGWGGQDFVGKLLLENDDAILIALITP